MPVGKKAKGRESRQNSPGEEVRLAFLLYLRLCSSYAPVELVDVVQEERFASFRAEPLY